LASASAGFQPLIVSPDPGGAHNWNPMAFHPATGLVYLPAKIGTQFLHAPSPKWKYDVDRVNVGNDGLYDGPLNDKLHKLAPPSGALVAWDPVAQKAAWSAAYPAVEGGGVLATAGNLVFQGRADGILAAYRATDGQQLWQFDAGTGIGAPPVTYMLDGVQYVSVMAGWGGGGPDSNNGKVKPGYGRILTFALGATATFNPPAYGHKEPPAPAVAVSASPKVVHQGKLLFGDNCAGCHGQDAVAGANPDLRYATKAVHDQFEAIVLEGARSSLGMPSFQKVLNAGQVRAIQAYVLSRAAEGARQASN
jgi:quinohemoprotein ethanol dehydrogenase